MNSKWTCIWLHLWCSGLRAEVFLRCTCQSNRQVCSGFSFPLTSWTFLYVVGFSGLLMLKTQSLFIYSLIHDRQTCRSCLHRGIQDIYYHVFIQSEVFVQPSSVLSEIAMKEDICLFGWISKWFLFSLFSVLWIFSQAYRHTCCAGNCVMFPL